MGIEKFASKVTRVVASKLLQMRGQCVMRNTYPVSMSEFSISKSTLTSGLDERVSKYVGAGVW